MKNVCAVTAGILLLAALSFAGVADTHLTGPANPSGSGWYGYSDEVLVDNLATSSGQIANGYSASTIGGAYNRWIAFDYTPPVASTLEKISIHWLYNRSTSSLGDVKYQVIKGTNPGVGSIVSTFTVVKGSITEVNTGMTAFSRIVWRGDMPLPNVKLDAKTKYWLAQQMVCSDNVFFAVRTDSIKEEMCWWYGDTRVWQSSQTAFNQRAEQSYRLEGIGSGVGVNAASFGKIKSLYY